LAAQPAQTPDQQTPDQQTSSQQTSSQQTSSQQAPGRTPETAAGAAGEPAREAELRQYEATASTFVERFAADMTEAGMQRMGARVFACLLASEEGSLNSVQLADRLRISPAAVSGAVRYLSQVRMVSREREPGSRRERYHIHEDIWYEVLIDRDNILNRWSATLRAGEVAVGPDTSAGERIRDTYDFLSFLESELHGLLERWHAHRAQRAQHES
jgi:predicted transcriptional regulator